MEIEIPMEQNEDEQTVNLKLSYYICGPFDDEMVKNMMGFINSYMDVQGIDLDLYVASPGGEIQAKLALQHLIENTHMNITLIGNKEISSAAFMLFYDCNLKKKLLDDTVACIHMVSAQIETRDLHLNDDYVKFRRKSIDLMNEKFLAQMKKNKAVSKKLYKSVSEGNDVFVLKDELHQILKNSPNGTFIE